MSSRAGVPGSGSRVPCACRDVPCACRDVPGSCRAVPSSSSGSRVPGSCRDVSRAGARARVSTRNCADMSATGGVPRAGVPAVYTTVPAGAALADKTGACR
nr:Hypothetical protein OIHUMI_52 [Orf virus]